MVFQTTVDDNDDDDDEEAADRAVRGGATEVTSMAWVAVEKGWEGGTIVIGCSNGSRAAVP